MNEIIKVVIKGASGFCCEDEAYHDRLVITQAGMNYEKTGQRKKAQMNLENCRYFSLR